MNPDRIRIGISGLPLGNHSGTGYYTEQLLRVLSERGRARFEVTVYGASSSKGWTCGHSLKRASPATLRWPLRPLSDFWMRHIARESDLIHYPNGVGPPQSRKPFVATLHDVSPFSCPETFPISQVLFLRKAFTQVAHRAALIVTDSHWQAEKIRELWPELAHKLRVVHPTLSPAYRTPPSEDAKPPFSARPYLLMVGTLEPRKRVQQALEAWRASAAEVDICLVGRWGWKTGPLKSLLAKLGPRTISSEETSWTLPDGRKLHHLESAPTGRLVDLYRNAVGLIYPSIFEGFGLPILEAMAVGCPVLTRKNSSMEEVAGRAGWYFEGDSSEELAAAIEEFVSNSDMRHGRAVIGQDWSKSFSDERFFEEMAAAYEAALEACS
ncbi:MAG: glycosyltransferase family 4 protein [Candidatus Omnitrophica bacterium]|nr:glycosyltransferase family 4 protein [Candidatus Omnitrophota bacterium]